jgi:hypothetical protein
MTYTAEAMMAVVHETCHHGTWHKLDVHAIIGAPIICYAMTFR